MIFVLSNIYGLDKDRLHQWFIRNVLATGVLDNRFSLFGPVSTF